ncbi:MAG: putative Proteasome, alpha subunit [Verrucomicrobiales bacterium]|nr:putative Proteasome, alpha subunit [Verrucomicrobiales bacterium]
MTEEPYRWLEAIQNRREYVLDQMSTGSPVLAVSIEAGILLCGVGSGNSKVFEIFDRHALAGLGHPADLEKIRQAAIDATHLEAFTRAPEDVSLRRLVSYTLSGILKNQFEQIYAAPLMAEVLLAELGVTASEDQLFRVHFDGSFDLHKGGASVAGSRREAEEPARKWLIESTPADSSIQQAATNLLTAWALLVEKQTFPPGPEPAKNWRTLMGDKQVELALLNRHTVSRVKYRPLTLRDAGLEP